MLHRREVLALIAAAFASAAARAAEGPITVWWEDLAPKEVADGTSFAFLQQLGALKVGEAEKIPWAIQPPASMVRDFDDKLVRVPGFLVPLSFDGFSVTDGLLVPYVGACIHVPPPPANQIVYVKLKEATEEASLWDPVWATGVFNTAAVETELADVGYLMEGATLEPYQE